jgi:hypothetical protein
VKLWHKAAGNAHVGWRVSLRYHLPMPKKEEGFGLERRGWIGKRKMVRVG